MKKRLLTENIDFATRVGVLTGFAGLLLFLAGFKTAHGRYLADPMPLMLTFQNVLRGSLIYIDWRGALLHLVFVAFLSLLPLGFFILLGKRRTWTKDEVRQAAKWAAIINVAVVALVEVDAGIVGVWYALAGAISVFLTTLIAAGFTSLYLTSRKNEGGH